MVDILKSFFFLVMQYPYHIPYEMRDHFNFILLLGEDNITNKKKLYDYYTINIFSSFKIFKSIFDKITDNYGCMVIDNRVKTKKKYFGIKLKKEKILFLVINDVIINIIKSLVTLHSQLLSKLIIYDEKKESYGYKIK